MTRPRYAHFPLRFTGPPALPQRTARFAVDLLLFINLPTVFHPMVHREDHDGRPGSELKPPRRPRNEGPARWREWRFSRLERAQNNKAGWIMTRRGCLGRSNRSIVSKFSQMFARSPRRSLRLPLRAESGGGRGESGRPRPTRRRRAPEVALQLRRHASASRDGDGGEAQRRQFFFSVLRETRGDDGRRTDADGSLARGRTRGWIFSRPSSRSRTSTRGTCSNPSGSGTCAVRGGVRVGER